MRGVYADASKFTQEQREQFDRLPINLTRMLLHCRVAMVQSFLDFALSFRTGNLEPKLRELVILRMATLNASSYELMHHLPAAKMVGWSEIEISAITSAQPSGLDEKHSVMIQMVDECSQLGKVSDSTFAKASKIFSASEIAEATLLAGLYEMLACFLKTMGVELDQHPLSWSEVDRSNSRVRHRTSA
ncbi:MAG: carboxymuconolactone decarboxylase family protein [Actinobacteria bacterium]|nr:carboxymuconolactone decarboxylase family protein [Actinomycetota bacterium]